ncbi:PREDICTED: 1-phosphatidylinositol 3-phosphate 5-kinase-like isoform X2 [Camelina sativa]|uniref:1-phosphatidylinositol 3-phosphate 5-kinase-like isoform X2 n=1 Tax=Camelina sativa TaxID=90675 RepID=A0ABM0VAL2_CAMSA|nr:PREDICTED: 1-phosphatidylinositol 3-phosphate 5-kinase-like isoform X2 [Camelina sativa]
MVSAAESSSSSSTLLLPCAFANSFAFMRLLQKAHHFSAVSEDDDNNRDIRLGSDHQAKDNNHHQVCRRDCSFMADQEEPRSTTSRLSSKDDDHDNNSNNNNNDNNNNNNNNNNSNSEAEDHEMRQQGWLRLSIGHEDDVKPDLDHRQQHQTDPTARRDSFLELNLFSGGSNRGEEVGLPLSSLFHHHQHQSGGMMINPLMFPTRPEEMIGPWAAAFRTPFVPQNLTHPSASSASLMMPLMGPYFGRSSFQPQLLGNNRDVVAGPSSSFRVIDPPRRPHSGIWFLLQASQNQTVEPFLPQIPKSYLRIKDGKMTVRLLMKYLVNKLRLEHESQVEIRCRGQELEPVLTLQHVRDAIWRGSRGNLSLSSQNITLLPNSSTSDHLMVLHYGRTIS